MFQREHHDQRWRMIKASPHRRWVEHGGCDPHLQKSLATLTAESMVLVRYGVDNTQQNGKQKASGLMVTYKTDALTPQMAMKKVGVRVTIQR